MADDERKLFCCDRCGKLLWISTDTEAADPFIVEAHEWVYAHPSTWQAIKLAIDSTNEKNVGNTICEDCSASLEAWWKDVDRRKRSRNSKKYADWLNRHRRKAA